MEKVSGSKMRIRKNEANENLSMKVQRKATEKIIEEMSTVRSENKQLKIVLNRNDVKKYMESLGNEIHRTNEKLSPKTNDVCEPTMQTETESGILTQRPMQNDRKDKGREMFEHNNFSKKD